MKAVGYVRVSTDEQAKHGISPDVQLARIEEFCNKMNWVLVEKFYDEDNDYIYNPFDRRGAYFDIWEEMREKDKVGNSQIYVGKAFVSNLFHGLIGKEKSNGEGFWDEASIQPLMDILIETHFKMKDATSSEKWENRL